MTASASPHAQLAARLRRIADLAAPWFPPSDCAALREAAAVLERVEPPPQENQHRADLREASDGEGAIMDFPTAWEFVRATEPLDHHWNCSWRTENGALLCDCHVLNHEYERRKWAREIADWRKVSEAAAFGKLRVEGERDEAQQGVEYALACIAEWQERYAALAALAGVSDNEPEEGAERSSAREEGQT